MTGFNSCFVPQREHCIVVHQVVPFYGLAVNAELSKAFQKILYGMAAQTESIAFAQFYDNFFFSLKIRS